jgi:hypothetical protein
VHVVLAWILQRVRGDVVVHAMRRWAVLGGVGGYVERDVRAVRAWKVFCKGESDLHGVPNWELLDRLWAGVVHPVPERVEHRGDGVQLVVAVQAGFQLECTELGGSMELSYMCITGEQYG